MATIQEILAAKGIATIPVKKEKRVQVESVVANPNSWTGPAPHLADPVAGEIFKKRCSACGEPRPITEFRHTRAGTRGKMCIGCVVGKIAATRGKKATPEAPAKRKCSKCGKSKKDVGGEFITGSINCKACRCAQRREYARLRKLHAHAACPHTIAATEPPPTPPTRWERICAWFKGESS